MTFREYIEIRNRAIEEGWWDGVKNFAGQTARSIGNLGSGAVNTVAGLGTAGINAIRGKGDVAMGGLKQAWQGAKELGTGVVQGAGATVTPFMAASRGNDGQKFKMFGDDAGMFGLKNQAPPQAPPIPDYDQSIQNDPQGEYNKLADAWKQAKGNDRQRDRIRQQANALIKRWPYINVGKANQSKYMADVPAPVTPNGSRYI